MANSKKTSAAKKTAAPKSKKQQKWSDHVNATWSANGGTYKDALIAAKKTYKK